MLKQSLRETVLSVTPGYVLDGYRHLKLLNHAKQLCALRNETEDPRAWIDVLFRSHFFRPLQRKTEILRLLEVIKAHRPVTICEIGAAGGGTTFLLANAAQPDALIISVDLEFNAARKAAISGFAQPNQKVVCLQGDSHRQETLLAVRDQLRGRELDVLYIDGDHTYEGVSADFKLFSQLVRPGGIIIFHDIVPDYRTQYGVETVSYTGDVPKFWNEIKAKYSGVEEIIEDPGQDGLGIGVLYWCGLVAPI